MSKARDILIRARQRITDRKHWTQGVCQRDAKGRAVMSNREEPVCWCALGALYTEADCTLKESHSLSQAQGVLAIAAKELGFPTIVSLNDTYQNQSERLKERAHAAVLMAFDLAIARSK